MRDIQTTNWWNYADNEIKELVKQSRDLVEQEKEQQRLGNKYRDYSFVVFPAAKGYEGFLKKLFLDMRLITRHQYFGEHFRIGRALSPTLPKRYRAGWVYGKLVASCQGEYLPKRMWEMWKKGRNRVFHYFPNYLEAINLEQAEQLVGEIVEMMDEALAGCRI